MNYVCGNCGNKLEKLNDDCEICMAREKAKKEKIQSDYDKHAKNP